MGSVIPTVKTWCLPEGLDEKQFVDLHQCIVKVMANFQETGVKNEWDMLALFPRDLMAYGLGTEIKIEISDLPPQCNKKILDKLASEVGNFVRTMFLRSNVYCKAECYNPSAGYWFAR
ncbi:MAG: hypothetical protein NTZ97_00610 [Candidatus Moranbacteria bacterium]|nr:hypothetical protein [Candidatus Moranbacteria bacterium]